MLRIVESRTMDAERYRIVSREESKKEDVRRNDEDSTPSVTRLTTATEPFQASVRPGDFYVPMDQPLANVISAALEPETQSSFAANHLLGLPVAGAANAVLPLYRVPARLQAATVVWDPE